MKSWISWSNRKADLPFIIEDELDNGDEKKEIQAFFEECKEALKNDEDEEYRIVRMK